jgi:hypothetical protein
MTLGLKNLKSSSKLSSNNDNITIDAKHNEMINYFKNQYNEIPKLKKELNKITIEYNKRDETKKNDIEYIIYRNNLRDTINEIKNTISTVLSNKELNNYYLNVGTLLHGYYENIENSKNSKQNSENFEENLINYDSYDNTEILSDNSDDETCKNNNSVINFFNRREKEENELDNEIESTKNDGVYTSLKISDFVKEESTFKKKNILDEYLQKINQNYISKIKIDENICKCPNCKIEMTIYPSDGIQICENCGIQQNILIESDKPSFKDPPMEVCYFSYKRINHYNEFNGINDKKLLMNMYKIYKLLKIIKKMIFNIIYIF